LKCGTIPRNGTGLQVVKSTGAKTIQIKVEHAGVRTWHDALKKEARQLNEVIDKVPNPKP